MAALIVLVALLAATALIWVVVVAARRGRAVRRQRAPWVVEQWANRGHTVVGVRRRPNPEQLTDQIVVASIPDSDTDWLAKRAKAWDEAQQRAVELNASVTP